MTFSSRNPLTNTWGCYAPREGPCGKGRREEEWKTRERREEERNRRDTRMSMRFRREGERGEGEREEGGSQRER
jgi:hypothetical protein